MGTGVNFVGHFGWKNKTKELGIWKGFVSMPIHNVGSLI